MGHKKTEDGSPIYARPQWRFRQKPLLRVDDGSEVMNIDGGPSGTAVIVWNGTGAGDTGGDWTRTGKGAENAAAAKSGTNGLNTQLTTVGDVSRFDNGSMIDVDGTYNSLVFWMKPKAVPEGSEVRIFWDDSSNDQVGDAVKLSDYVDNFDIDVWQHVVIPIADFNLTGNAQKLLFRYTLVDDQQWHFDDIELYPSGGPYRFRVSGSTDYTCHMKRLILSFAEDTSAWTKDYFLSISGGLANGLILRYRDLAAKDVLWTMNLRDNLTLFSRLELLHKVSYASNVEQYTMVLEPIPAAVPLTSDLVVEAVVQDNLSSLNALRAFAQCGAEEL
jgi:hypothetical protein